jgi:ABC-type dipeptide/oligopeptide/nickel transport system ATPase subunit
MNSAARYKLLRCDVALIFQDPRSSLNPRLSVGAAVQDPLRVLKIGSRSEQKDKVIDLLDRVGLSKKLVTRPTHSLSGGQLQRVALARALAVEPSVIIADEPTSALDVSVQAQILNLINDIQRSRGLGLLIVSHDMRVVRFLADRTAVMYEGKIVEVGPTSEIYAEPQHPYTKSLITAAPVLRFAKTYL